MLEKYKDFRELQTFLQLCKIPHASFNTEQMRDFIIKRAKAANAKVSTDEAGNILCLKGDAKICLQGHYDMVYVSENEHFSIEPFLEIENGVEFLKARDSSLGADNGAALACMLELLESSEHLECLFTNDEEVGMIGANNIKLKLHSPFMLNCDSEDIDEVVYSCAGGYDLKGAISFKNEKMPNDFICFSVQTTGFSGGHSGIEIHKNIKNAIIESTKLIESLLKIGAKICTFSGGEKRNSIPVGAKFEFGINKESVEICKNIIKESGNFILQECDKLESYFDAKLLCEAILGLENGVIETKNNEVILSSNIGILTSEIKDSNIICSIFTMGRGNEIKLMKEQSNRAKGILEKFGFNAKIVDFYAPWEMEDSKLLSVVLEVYKKMRKNAVAKSIHAGLECGVLKQIYPDVNFVSIGPSIYHPHSVREKMDLQSFVQFSNILKEILKRF